MLGGQIHVKTSGVTFDRNTGLVTTAQRVDFSMAQGAGARWAPATTRRRGYLTLDQAVELTTHRGADEVQIHAQHAEFDRGAQTLPAARGNDGVPRRPGRRGPGQDSLSRRWIGSAPGRDGRLYADHRDRRAPGGAHWRGMDFDEHNQPRHGHLEGGVTMDSSEGAAQEGRTVHGTSPTAELEFTAQGELRHAHLERGVDDAERDETSAGDRRGQSAAT